MRSVLVYEKSSGRVVDEIVAAMKKIWPGLGIVSLADLDHDDFDSRQMVVLPGYDIVLSLGVDALSRCAADWQATQACYVLHDPRHAAEWKAGDRQTLVTAAEASEDDSNSLSFKVPTLSLYHGEDSSSSREFRAARIQLDRFDPITYHIASTSQIWNSLPARSIRRLEQILPPPINTEFFTPGHMPRDEAYFCIHEECLAGTAAIVDACQLAGRRLVIGTHGSADLIPDALSCQDHVQIVELHDLESLRDQFWNRRALIVTQGGWIPHVLEAQACGMPVIIADRGYDHTDEEFSTEQSLIIEMDSSRQGTGLFCDDDSCQSLFAAISELERRPHLFSPDLAWANAARYSTECFAHLLKQLAERARASDLQSSAWARNSWRKAG